MSIRPLTLSRRAVVAGGLAAAGSALVHWHPAGAAAGPIAPLWLDVTQPLPNGVAGATTADTALNTADLIQARIDYANTVVTDQDGGAVVYLPTGHYTLRKPLVLRRHVWLVGDGTSSMLRIAGGFAGDAVILCNAPESAPVVISDLMVNVTGEHTAPITGIYVETPPGQIPSTFVLPDGSQIIERVTMFGITYAGISIGPDSRGVSIADCDLRGRLGAATKAGVGLLGNVPDGTVHNVRCRDFATGFYVTGPLRRMSSCRAEHNTVGFHLHNEGTQMSNCVAADNVNHGYWITGGIYSAPGARKAGMMVMTGCAAYGNGGHGIYLEQTPTDPDLRYSNSHSLWGIQAVGNTNLDVRVGNHQVPPDTTGQSVGGVRHSVISGTAGTLDDRFPGVHPMTLADHVAATTPTRSQTHFLHIT